jgi:hypothetical protein
MEGIDAEYGTHRFRTWQEKIQSLEVTNAEYGRFRKLNDEQNKGTECKRVRR